MNKHHTNSMPMFSIADTLRHRKRIREGDLHNRSLRSIAYELKASERHVQDMVSGEGKYADYTSEGVIDRKKYAMFFEGHLTFAQCAAAVLKAQREAIVAKPPPQPYVALNGHGPATPLQNGNGHEAPGVHYNVDRNLLVDGVKVVRREPLSRKGIPHRSPGIKPENAMRVAEEVRQAYATETKLTVKDLCARYNISDATLDKMRTGEGRYKGLRPLPVRPRNFDRYTAPESVQDFLRRFGKVTMDFGAEYKYVQPEPDPVVPPTKQYGPPAGTTMPMETPPGVPPPLMPAQPLPASVVAQVLSIQDPVYQDTSPPAPEPQKPAQARPEAADTTQMALIRQMLEAVGPETLGWVKLPEDPSLDDILTDMRAALELHTEALGRLAAWGRKVQGGG